MYYRISFKTKSDLIVQMEDDFLDNLPPKIMDNNALFLNTRDGLKCLINLDEVVSIVSVPDYEERLELQSRVEAIIRNTPLNNPLFFKGDEGCLEK